VITSSFSQVHACTTSVSHKRGTKQAYSSLLGELKRMTARDLCATARVVEVQVYLKRGMCISTVSTVYTLELLLALHALLSAAVADALHALLSAAVADHSCMPAHCAQCHCSP
jgi:hypothetical protein